MKYSFVRLVLATSVTGITHRSLFQVTERVTEQLLAQTELALYNPDNWIGKTLGLAAIGVQTTFLLEVTEPLGQLQAQQRLIEQLKEQATVITTGVLVGSATYSIAHFLAVATPSQFLISVLTGFMAAAAADSYQPAGGNRLLRGFKLTSSRKVAALWRWAYTKGLIPWGAAFIEPANEPTHMALIGNTGAGKSTFIEVMMSRQRGLAGVGIIPDMRAVVLDAKREIVRLLFALGVPFKIWNPMDERCVAWDIGWDIVGEGLARELAAIIFADETNHSDNNPYFSNSGKLLLSGIIVALQHAYGRRWTLRHLILVTDNLRDLRDFLRRHHPRSAAYEEFLHKKENGPNEILTTLQSKLQPLAAVAARWEQANEKVSLAEWLQREEVLVLGSDTTYAEAIKLVNSLILQFLVAQLNALPSSQTRRIWLYIDEATAAGRFIRLEALVALGRGAGVCVVIAFQNIAAFMQTYSEKLAESILGLCRHWAIFGVDSWSADWLSKQIGSYEALRQNTAVSQTLQPGPQGISQSYSQSQQQQVIQQPTVLSQELMDKARPQTGPRSGELVGHFMGPDIPLHRHRYPWKRIRQWRVQPVEEAICPAYLKVSESDPTALSLPSLTPEERTFLGLKALNQ